MSRKRPASDAPPPQEEDDPLVKLHGAITGLLASRASVLQSSQTLHEHAHTAEALQRSLLAVHGNVSERAASLAAEQAALQQLQLPFSDDAASVSWQLRSCPLTLAMSEVLPRAACG